MAKTNTPFFSLGSQGSVAESITSQKRGRDTVIRQLPVPTDPYSLSQAYQRWLYLDYAHLWRQQSAATRAVYRTGGSRHHLTGFQYWMKAHLTSLPDLAGWWKLDDNTGVTTIDSSRRNNPATIFGASPATGLINGCLSFDGNNDYLAFGTILTLGVLTFEWFFKSSHAAGNKPIFAFRGASSTGLTLIGTKPVLELGAANYQYWDSVSAYLDGNWHHWVLYIAGDAQDDIDNCLLTIDTIVQNKWVKIKTGLPNAWTDFWLARSHAAYGYLSCLVDNLRVYNEGRILDTTEIERHSERRYPPQ